jgi:hypothetical protein
VALNTNSSSAEVKERVELYLYSLLDLHGLLQGEICFYFEYCERDETQESVSCQSKEGEPVGVAGIVTGLRDRRPEIYNFSQRSRPVLESTHPPVKSVLLSFPQAAEARA